MQLPVAEVARELQDLGFERGWGSTVGRVRETMHMLLDLMQAPDAEVLQVMLCSCYSNAVVTGLEH